MKHAYTWGAILAVVLASTTGDVLLSRAMKQVGDVGELRRRSGLLTVAGRVLRNPSFLLGVFCHGRSVLQPAVRFVLGRRQLGGAGLGFSDLRGQCYRREILSA